MRVAAWAAALVALVPAAAAAAGLYEADSKQLGDGKMDVVVKEIERRPRASVVQVAINGRASSVGTSIFIACSIRQLAQQRGARHVVKLEDRPARGQMLVGFLQSADEDPGRLGPEFGAAPREAILDLEQFAPVCGFMK